MVILLRVQFVEMVAKIRVHGFFPIEIVGYVPGNLILVVTMNLAVSSLAGGVGIGKSELTCKAYKLSVQDLSVPRRSWQ